MITALNLCYTYPGGGTVGPVDLAVGPGEWVVLVGETGSGKSTIVRCLAGITAADGAGTLLGSVHLDEVRIADLAPVERARRVGFVRQEVDDQSVASTVAEELAFSLLCLGWEDDAIAERVQTLIHQFDLPDPERRLDALSGGQRQRVAIAAAIAAGARNLILDEPFAHLDPEAAERIAGDLRRLADDGVTIVQVEHRLGPIWHRCDRLLVLEGGVVVGEGPPSAMVSALRVRRLWTPGSSENVEERAATVVGEAVLCLRDVDIRRQGRCVLTIAELRFHAGERVAILGANGAGKTTLIQCLAGELPATRDVVGRVLAVPQDPDLALFGEDVAAELAFGSGGKGSDRLRRLADRLGILWAWDRPPASLSRGERLRVALAAALACEPEALLLDEPTAGQDPRHVLDAMLALMENQSTLVIFATHDRDLARKLATRVVVLDAGRLVYDGPKVPTVPPVNIAPPVVLGRLPKLGADPALAVVALVSLGWTLVAIENTLLMAVFAIVGLALAASSSFVRARWRTGIAVVALLTWSTVVSQALFYGDPGRGSGWQLGPVTVWRDGAVHGLKQALRLVAMASVGAALGGRLTVPQWTEGLTKVGLPFGLSFLAATAARFVPVSAKEWATVRRARDRRLPLGVKRLWIKWSSELVLWRPVVARAIRRSRVLAESLSVRGFDPQRRRKARPSSASTRLAMGAVAIGAASVVGLRLMYWSYASDVWWNPRWLTIYGWIRRTL